MTDIGAPEPKTTDTDPSHHPPTLSFQPCRCLKILSIL